MTKEFETVSFTAEEHELLAPHIDQVVRAQQRLQHVSRLAVKAAMAFVGVAGDPENYRLLADEEGQPVLQRVAQAEQMPEDEADLD